MYSCTAVARVALWNLLEVQKNDKNITTRVLWCLSTQQIPLDYLKDDLPKLISKVGEVLISRESISVAVDQEGLNVLKRLVAYQVWVAPILSVDRHLV